MNDVDDEVWERRLDWALAEHEGGASPPDVTAQVLARVAQLPAVPGAPAATARAAGSRWTPGRMTAAAIALLGIGVVIGSLLWPAGDPEQVVAQDPDRAGVEWHRATSRAEIDALPADTRFVEGINLVDDDVAALARLTGLEGLRLLAGTFKSGPAPAQWPERQPMLSPAALPHLRPLQRLRVLELDWQEELYGADLGVLAELPLLEELGLVRFDTDDQALAVLDRLPALRALDLTLNHGFHGETIARIARLPGLRRLQLVACSQLSMAMLAPLAGMQRLEALDLSGIGGSWRGHLAGYLTGAANERRQQQQAAATAAGAGVDATVGDLLPMGLRQLVLGQTAVTDQTIRALALRLRALQELDLTHCQQLTDVAVAQAIALPQLRRLSLTNCSGLGSTSIDLLEQARQLRTVVLRGLRWLEVPHVQRLLARGINVEVDQPRELVNAVALLRERYRDRLRARADELLFAVVNRTGIDTLPADTVAVEGHDLDDAAVTALVQRLPRLERLRLRTGEQTKTYNGSFAPQTSDHNRRDLTAAGLASVARLGQLTELELAGTVGIGDDGLAHLQALPRLQRLRLCAFDVSDRVLAALPGMPALRALELSLSFGCGAAGIRAIAASKQLEELRLSGLPQLQEDELALLGTLTRLRTLSLANLSTTRNDGQRTTTPAEQQRRDEAIALGERPGAGLTDRALLALRDLVGLDHLVLAFGKVTDAGIAALGGMHRLQTLDLTGNAALTAGSLAALPRSLVALELTGCKLLDDGLAPQLRPLQLQKLSLDGCERLTDQGLAALVASQPRLRRLEVAGCSGLSEASAELLFAERQLHELDVTGCRGWDKDRVEQARAQGRQITYRVW